MAGSEELTETDRRFLVRFVPVAAFIGGLCCFTPVAVVLLGIGSVSYAVSLTDLLYYEYAWAFRLAGLTFLLSAFVVHLYVNEEVCSVDVAVRKRRQILNLLGVVLTAGAIAYVVWLYVIVEIVGLLLGIW
ncbi:hypothetical protein CV102_00310 [Natronococcus pandeyae]|uniref:Mercuric transport protein MerT n=1 Tax=Natronococcus pandeyae TaxID=2055836 RepID=A0A8J8TTC7_9EURY|nr:hypothetical protein [Natronococcus pandeyae]TYL40060.1 hypothetical protein CV102_00310 [Natronococcus pandeyae]